MPFPQCVLAARIPVSIVMPSVELSKSMYAEGGGPPPSAEFTYTFPIKYVIASSSPAAEPSTRYAKSLAFSVKVFITPPSTTINEAFVPPAK
jgi:hypothetical protein